jgi:thioesterase DpgC
VNVSERDADRWINSPPSCVGTLEIDASGLTDYVDGAETLLNALRPKPARSPGEQRIAAEAHRCCRQVRTRFMRLHGGRVYDELTENRRRELRVDELVYRAAELFPGLVPSRAQIAKERQRAQADKEGREIDQGIFFRELLRLPDIGRHIAEAMLRPTRRAQELLPAFRARSELSLPTVHIRRVDVAAHITICNNECLNAEDDNLVADMETAVDVALLDPNVQVGVLRGGPMTHPKYRSRRVFCSGINLKDLYSGQISFVDFLLRRELGYVNKLLRGLRLEAEAGFPSRLQKPWGAAVDTFAIGGGMQMLLVVDRVVAGSDSYMSLPATKEGLIPGAASLRLSRALPSRVVRDVILGGRKLLANEPNGSLLIDEVVDPSDMDAAVARSVDLLAAPAVAANRRMLNMAAEPLDQFREYMAEFALEQAHRLYSPDLAATLSRSWARSAASTAG